MRVLNILLVIFVALLIVDHAHCKKYRDDEADERGVREKKRSHEYTKYDKISNENNGQKYPDKRKQKPVIEEDDSSEEIQIIQYRKKKDKNKKTLGDVFQEKKQKKVERKKRFEKNVLRHFKEGDEDEYESSEEVIIAPLRRMKAKIDCNSAEEDCD